MLEAVVGQAIQHRAALVVLAVVALEVLVAIQHHLIKPVRVQQILALEAVVLAAGLLLFHLAQAAAV